MLGGHAHAVIGDVHQNYYGPVHDDTRQLRDQLQKSFWYPEIGARVASIETSGKQHYSWLFDAAEYTSRMKYIKHPWSSISDWLASDDHLYWI